MTEQFRPEPARKLYLSRYSDRLLAGRAGDRIPVEARFSVPVQTSPGSHPAFYMGTGSFPGVKSDRSVMLNPHLLLVPWSRKSRAIHLLPLLIVRPVQNLSACTVQLYHYSPYRPYGLYRASVPVQYSYTSTNPMGLTACKEHQCLYSTAKHLHSYEPYSLYKPSEPVQYS